MEEEDIGPPPLPPPCRIPRRSGDQNSVHHSLNVPPDLKENPETAAPALPVPKPRKPVPLPRSKIAATPKDSSTSQDDSHHDQNGTGELHSIGHYSDTSSARDPLEPDYLSPITGLLPYTESPSPRSSPSASHSIPRVSPNKPHRIIGRSVSDAISLDTISVTSNLIRWESVDDCINGTDITCHAGEIEPDAFSMPPELDDTPPGYSPPPPPDGEDVESSFDLLDEEPPPLPPRPIKKSPRTTEKIDQPPLPVPVGNRNAIRHESEVRNGIATLCSDYLTLKCNQKDQGKKWCVLREGKLSIFADKKAPIAKKVILCVEILEISVLAERKNKLTFGFELIHLRERGKIWSFVCDSKEDANRWAFAAAKGVCDASGMYATTPIAGCQEYEHAGKLFLRRGSSGEWVKIWLELIGRTIRVFSEDQMEEYDLRKAVSFTVVNLDFYESKAAAVCPDATEESTPFILNMPGRNLHFQADTEKQTQSWMKLMQKRARECGDAVEDQPLTVEDVPVIVDRCIQFISTHGLHRKGIYRLSGVNSKIATIIDMFAKDAHSCYLLKDNFTEHDVAGALKRFLRNLPEPLVKIELYQPLLHCAEQYDDVNIKLQKYKSLLDQLPRKPNYVTLKKLLGHLKLVTEHASDNSMPIMNMATSFGSTLFGENSSQQPQMNALPGNNSDLITKEIQVMVDFLTFYETLFDIKEEDLVKERKILAALEILNKQKGQLPRAGDFLMGVYWVDRTTEPVNMRITSRLTAGEVCRNLLERENLQHDNTYSLYEVIFEEKLVRPVHYSEEVIPIILRWTDWNSCNICEYASNYLCVRKNDLYQKAAKTDGFPLSLTQQLQFSRDKKFKAVSMDFTKMSLSVHKSLKSDKELDSWRIEDIVWFLGCSPQRAPPTKWSFSFIEKDKDVLLKRLKENRTAFGYTVCCDDEASLDKWILAMLQAQFNNDLFQKI